MAAFLEQHGFLTDPLFSLKMKINYFLREGEDFTFISSPSSEVKNLIQSLKEIF